MGLQHLQGLPELKELWLTQVQVTGAGVAELRRAMPKGNATTRVWLGSANPMG